MSRESAPVKNSSMGFWEHVDELVKRLKVVLAALILSISIWWLPTSLSGITNPIGGYQPLLSLVMLRIKQDFLPSQATLIAGGMGDTVFAMAYLSVVMGILLASPVVFYEVYAFVKPALHESEKKVVMYYMGAFIGLLILGGMMAYFVVIPLTFKILIYFTMQGGAAPFINIKDFYNWIYTLLAINSVFYTIPVFIVMLVQVGILPIKYLRGKKRVVLYLAIFVIVWIFGPNPDPTGISDALMMAPFFLVFEVATYIASRIDRTKNQRKATGFDEHGTSVGTSKDWFRPIQDASVCKFCNTTIEEGVVFCPSCNRSLK